MKTSKVLDSWALLAYFEGQESGAKVVEILKQASKGSFDLLISVINWGEILYIIEMRHGRDKRDEVERFMNQMQLDIIHADRELTREAAGLKAAYKLPYADCFAAALAKTRKAAVVTGDKDFEPLEKEIRIEWL